MESFSEQRNKPLGSIECCETSSFSGELSPMQLTSYNEQYEKSKETIGEDFEARRDNREHNKGYVIDSPGIWC